MTMNKHLRHIEGQIKESWRINDSLKNADYQTWQQDSTKSSNDTGCLE